MSDIFVFVEHIQGAVSDITYISLAQARVTANVTGGKVVALLLGNDKALATRLAADEVLFVEHPSLAEYSYDANVKVLADIITERKPGMVIFGDTSIGSDIASGLSARLDLPLVSFCAEIKETDRGLEYVSQICGGKVMAEGKIPAGTTLFTLLPGKFKVDEGQSATAPKVTSLTAPYLGGLRVTLKEYQEPSGEDIDISKENILVAVGRGIENEDNVAIAQELADALGGAVCASRPVVDQGWLPTTRLVGKSGKNVKARLYLALGISGAPEHVEAIGSSDVIIAVNTDPNAPIFNVAKYGIVEDLIDITEGLTAAVKEEKGG
ncbi:MAG: electron transfer flavoprotein subunit alpha/FixB family protein [Chloroflexi bacterium]|nr:electron transfer flavoprotein subunit alpha/FixB family protein [Chloroflexota bacterium]